MSAATDFAAYFWHNRCCRLGIPSLEVLVGHDNDVFSVIKTLVLCLIQGVVLPSKMGIFGSKPLLEFLGLNFVVNQDINGMSQGWDFWCPCVYHFGSSHTLRWLYRLYSNNAGDILWNAGLLHWNPFDVPKPCLNLSSPIPHMCPGQKSLYEEWSSHL